jgi:hypothetical protein
MFAPETLAGVLSVSLTVSAPNAASRLTVCPVPPVVARVAVAAVVLPMP